MMAEIWTAERTDRLKALWADGLSASRIAAELGDGVTRNGVIGRAHRVGAARRIEGQAPADASAKRLASARMRPSRAKAPTAVAPPEPRAAGPVTTLDLKPHHCRWPMGEVTGLETLFCGEVKDEGSSYCPAHRARAVQPVQRRMRRAA